MALQQATAFASAARTATPTPAIVDVADDVATAEIVIAVTAITLTPSVVFNIEAQDDTGAWYVLLASAAITAAGTTRLILGPGVVAAANVAVQAVLPRALRVRPVHADADSITYSVSYRAR